jgi:hypothetical protein
MFVSRPTVLTSGRSLDATSPGTHRLRGRANGFAHQGRVRSQHQSHVRVRQRGPHPLSLAGKAPRKRRTARRIGARLSGQRPAAKTPHPPCEPCACRLWLCETHAGHVRSWTLEQHEALQAPVATHDIRLRISTCGSCLGRPGARGTPTLIKTPKLRRRASPGVRRGPPAGRPGPTRRLVSAP